jgi:predicted dehydrogenase
MPPLRIGFIGAGANTRALHIPRLREQPDVELTVVCNRSRASGEAVAAEFGIARVAGSVEEVFSAPDVDAVCIGTWPYRHRDYAIAALDAGKHVLCEARMAMNAAEAAEMLAASRAHPGLVAQLVPAPFDFRLGPTIQRLLAERALGDIIQVAVTILNGTALDRSAPIHWRNQVEYSGRNVMFLGIYNEIMQRWFGDTSSVAATGSILIQERPDPATGQAKPIEIPDTYVVTGRLASGPIISYHLSSVAAGAPFSGVAVYGTEATLLWRPDDTAEVRPRAGTPYVVEPDPGTDRGWQVEADFVASIREGAPVRLTNFEDGLKYMRFIDACWTSWKEGRTQAL